MRSVIFPGSFSDTGHCVIGGGVNYSTNTFVCELESKKHNPDEGLESVTAHPGAAGVEQLGFIRNTGSSIHQRHKSKTKKNKEKKPNTMHENRDQLEHNELYQLTIYCLRTI